MRSKLLSIVLLVSTSLFVKGQDLGVNVNERLATIDTNLLVESKATWIRGFVDIPMFFLNIDNDGKITGVNDAAIENFSRINPFLDAGKINVNGEPVKLILSLKINFRFKNIGVPEMGSSEMTHLLDAIEKFLKSKDIGQKIDILVLGNEPMWETKKSEASDYGVFLDHFANLVAAWKTQNVWGFDVFIGALNRAEELKHSNPVIPEVINVLKTNINVDGIDLHPHCLLINQVEDDLSFIRDTHGITKKIILTEFSLHRMFVQHSNEPLGDWGKTYGYPASTPMYEWVNILMRDAAAGKPHPPEEMLSFFESRSWYPENWFKTFYSAFEKYDVSVATYRLQDEMTVPPRQLASTSALWELNALYNGKLMGETKEGEMNTNPIVYPDWAKIVNLDIPKTGRAVFDPVID